MDKNIFKKYCTDIKNILEAGSHDGRDTIEFAKMFPNSNIYAFEPASQLYNILELHSKTYTNIKPYQIGLYNYNGEGDFYICSGGGNASSSALEPTGHLKIHPSIKFNKEDKIRIKYFTIDEWAKQNNVESIDIMWLDMQGIEKEVIEASPNIIKTVKAIYSEISTSELYKGTCLYKDYCKWMESIGFYIALEDGFCCESGNVLFVRK